MKTVFQYSLAKKGKHTCPRCGKKTFVLYVDREGNALNPEVGKCDRADNCGWHYPPRKYFEETRATRPDFTRRAMRPFAMPRPFKHVVAEPTYIPKSMLVESVNAAKIVGAGMEHGNPANNLITWLLGYFAPGLVNNIVFRYYIGTSSVWPGATVFYQVDGKNRVRRGKVMQYNPLDGHRVKVPRPLFTTIHKAKNLGDNLPPQCLFGAHLLAEHKAAPVVVVESEKTACFLSPFTSDIVVATGGCSNLTKAMCEPLAGREVLLLPDNGQYQKWSDKGRELARQIRFKSLAISGLLEADGGNGDDIVDLMTAAKWNEIQAATTRDYFDINEHFDLRRATL